MTPYFEYMAKRRKRRRDRLEFGLYILAAVLLIAFFKFGLGI